MEDGSEGTRKGRPIEIITVAPKLRVMVALIRIVSVEIGRKVYRFGDIFGSRNDKTLANELDMRDEKIDERSKMTSGF